MAGLRGLIIRVSTTVTRVAERRRVLFVSATVLVMGLALLTVSFATGSFLGSVTRCTQLWVKLLHSVWYQ